MDGGEGGEVDDLAPAAAKGFTNGCTAAIKRRPKRLSFGSRARGTAAPQEEAPSRPSERAKGEMIFGG